MSMNSKPVAILRSPGEPRVPDSWDNGLTGPDIGIMMPWLQLEMYLDLASNLAHITRKVKMYFL